MSIKKIVTEVEAHEVDGEDCPVGSAPILRVLGHWNVRDLVVFQIQGGKKYTFIADDVDRAIRNAINHR